MADIIPFTLQSYKGRSRQFMLDNWRELKIPCYPKWKVLEFIDHYYALKHMFDIAPAWIVNRHDIYTDPPLFTVAEVVRLILAGELIKLGLASYCEEVGYLEVIRAAERIAGSGKFVHVGNCGIKTGSPGSGLYCIRSANGDVVVEDDMFCKLALKRLGFKI